ncbi:MAG: TIGR02757 family protein [Syntrophorhabdaceae bacterium]
MVKTVHLDSVYEKEKGNCFHHGLTDPVSFIHRWQSDRDREIAGFLAAQFAYGKIQFFMSFLTALFGSMHMCPADFVEKGSWESITGLYYRFQKDNDLKELFQVLKSMLHDHGTLGNMFRSLYDGDIRATIWRVRDEYLAGNDRLLFFFPRRGSTGANKRWNMYLRWMVRKDEIDIGIWDFIDPADLVIPLDTHLYKIGKCRGWTSRNTPSYKAAQEITEALKCYSPADPLKYDLFLCHMVGIGSGCTGEKTEKCREACSIYEI